MAARLLVDLGAKAPLLLAEPFVERQRLRAKFGRRVRSTLGAGVGGESRYDFVRLRAMRFGPITERAIIVGLSAERTIGSAWFDGLLGFDLLAAGRVIFDYPRRRLIIEPVASLGESKTTYDRSGLVLVARGERLSSFVVHRVVDGGPAEDAGVARGDSLISVDGRPASEWTLAALQQRLASRTSAVVLVLSRGSKLRTVRLPLRDLL